MYTSYHFIIPERVEVLKQIKDIIVRRRLKFKVHKSIVYGGRTLEMLSVIINPSAKKTILVSAGIHGMEPAPVYAIKDYLRSARFPKGLRIIVVPCVNPYGFCIHNDKNHNKVNLNRDFKTKVTQEETNALAYLVGKHKPFFAFTLHEDPDEDSFYLYMEGDCRNKAEKVVRLASKHIRPYKKKRIHRDMAIDGIVTASKIKNTFESYLLDKGIPNICIETPGKRPLTDRINTYKEILDNLNVVVKE